MVIDIVKDVNSLTKPCLPFLFGEHNSRELAENLIDTMVHAPGIGLAANQIGIPVRVFAFMEFNDNGVMSEAKPRVIFNPKIANASTETIELEEGCLSFPGLIVDIKRPKIIRVEYQDIRGDFHEATLDGLLSRIWQHEIEHLDGKLFYNNLPPVKRWYTMKKWKKNVKR